MQVTLQNDGPVTLELESPPHPEKTAKKSKSACVNNVTEERDTSER